MGEKKHGGSGIMNTIQGQSYHHHQLQEHHPPPPSSSPPTTNSLPPVLLESTTTPSLSSLLESHNPTPPLMHIQNPFLFQHHESDLKSFTSPSHSLFPTITGCFQTNPSPNSNTNSIIIPTTNNKNNTETNASPSPSSSLLRSLLLSNQDYFTIPKQCKTEAIFSHIDQHPLPDHPSSLGYYWGLDKTNHTNQITSSSSYCQNPIPNFGVDFSVYPTVGFSSLADGVGTKLAAGGTTTTSSLAFNKSGFHQMLLDMM